MKNRLYCGDNLEILATLEKESVDLIYIDPPFFSNRNYEIIWGDEAEIRSFEDRWDGGINVYIDWMKDRTMELHRILKPMPIPAYPAPHYDFIRHFVIGAKRRSSKISRVPDTAFNIHHFEHNHFH